MNIFECWEIKIIDFKPDSEDGAGYAIVADIAGPRNFTETIRVSFRDDFIETYFKVHWYQSLAEEEDKLEKAKRDLFIRWTLVRIERWIKEGQPGNALLITAEKDMAWAHDIEKGILRPASKPVGEYSFRYDPRK